jgi:2-methylisocitrate lyase-like PEP mutase family enzyme
MSQREKAEHFRALHHGPGALVLPNAWDASSAAIFARAGFPAVGTTSGGVAALYGYPDGERIPVADMLHMVERIAASVPIPVSADLEAGYGPTPERVGATIRAAIAAGAVGVNLEDGRHGSDRRLADSGEQVEVIAEARRIAALEGVPIVVNARTDVYLRAAGDERERFDEAVRRANAYRGAGADCLFLMGVRNADTIGRLVRAIDGPVNVVGGPGTPTIPELERLGVARVSVASGVMRATLPVVARIAEELRATGTYGAMTQSAFTHATVNRLFER